MFVTDTAETDGGRVVTECKRLNHINFEKQCILGNMHKTINIWLLFVTKTKNTTVLIGNYYLLSSAQFHVSS